MVKCMKCGADLLEGASSTTSAVRDKPSPGRRRLRSSRPLAGRGRVPMAAVTAGGVFGVLVITVLGFGAGASRGSAASQPPLGSLASVRSGTGSSPRPQVATAEVGASMTNVAAQGSYAGGRHDLFVGNVAALALSAGRVWGMAGPKCQVEKQIGINAGLVGFSTG